MWRSPGAWPAGVPAHAGEIRPVEPFTPEEWDYLVEVGERLMHDRPPHLFGHGPVYRGASAFTRTDSGNDLPFADAMVIAVAAELRILGRPLPFDYTLQGRGRAIRRSFGRGQGQRVSRCRPTHERPPPGRRPLTMIVGGAAADTTPPADRRRYQNPRVRLLAAFDRLDDEGRDLLTDFAGKYALVLETSGA